MPHQSQEAEDAKVTFLTSACKREFSDDCACQQVNLMSRRAPGKSKICLVLRSGAVEKIIIFFLTSRVESVDNTTKSCFLVFFPITQPNTRIDISEIVETIF